MNFYFALFCVAGFVGGVTSEDPLCLVEVLSEVTPMRFFINPDFVCQGVEYTFEQAESNIRKCTNQNVDLSKLIALHEDFCDADSYFSREFSKNRECFLDRMAEGPACYDRWLNEPDTSGKETCSNLIAETTECLNRGVKEICGDSGVEAYERMNHAQGPLLTAICYEMNGAALASLVSWLLLAAAMAAVAWHQY